VQILGGQGAIADIGIVIGADRIGQIHQPGHEEGDRRAHGERGLEARHDQRRQHAARQAEQQPGQAVAQPAQRRRLDRLARLQRLRGDAGEAVQILHVLPPQDVHQRGRGHHA